MLLQFGFNCILRYRTFYSSKTAKHLTSDTINFEARTASLLQIFIAMKQSPFSDFVREGNILSQMTFAITTNVMTILCIYNMVKFPIMLI